MTTVLVLVILAAIWAAVLVPPYLQNRRETRPGDSIATFRSQLSVLERATPGARSSNLARLDVGRYEIPRYAPTAARRPQPTPASRRAEARRRRRDVFLTLLGAVGVTFVLALALGGSVWMLHFAVDALFVGYVLLLVNLQQQSVQTAQTVRYIQPPQLRQAPQHELLLRRSGT